MRTFLTTADLKAQGKTARQISAAAEARRLLPVRKGVLARPSAETALVRAVRVGGVATAQTAARSLGLWTPPDARSAAFRRRASDPHLLHVAVPSSATRLRLHDPDDAARPLGARADVVLHWTAPAVLRPFLPTGRVDLLLLLEHLFRCETPERALAVLDSAPHLRHLQVRDLHALAARLPAHQRPVVFSADGRAESGTETIVRFRLRAAGLRVEVQRRIDGVGTVDLLVEGRVIVECDGREWHDDDEAFEQDRTRDLGAALGRYRTLRVTWFRVLFRWESVEAGVFALLGR